MKIMIVKNNIVLNKMKIYLIIQMQVIYYLYLIDVFKNITIFFFFKNIYLNINRIDRKRG